MYVYCSIHIKRKRRDQTQTSLRTLILSTYLCSVNRYDVISGVDRNGEGDDHDHDVGDGDYDAAPTE